MQVVGGALGICGGLEDGAFIRPENLQPIAEIGGVVLAGLGNGVKIRAKECDSHFRDKFLAGKACIPPNAAGRNPYRGGRPRQRNPSPKESFNLETGLPVNHGTAKGGRSGKPDF